MAKKTATERLRIANAKITDQSVKFLELRKASEDIAKKCGEVEAENEKLRGMIDGQEEQARNQVKIENRRQRRNTFLADAVRDENDGTFLNAEISKRKYKGKLKTITTIKHYDLIDGDFVTEFIIDLKE